MKPLLYRLISLCLMALPASAGDLATWGIPASSQSSVQIIAVDDGAHIATIQAVNEMNSGTLDLILATIVANGVSYRVRIEQGAGNAPDRYIVETPPGFLSVPEWADVPEGGHAQFLIFARDAMELG